MKKGKSKKQSESVPPIVHYVEGDGITQYRRVTIPGHPKYIDQLKRLSGGDRPRARNSVDHAFRNHIEWAKETLTAAGLPAEAMREGKFWGLLGYVESKGYKPRSAPEWYAADLLESSDRIAVWLTRGDPGEVETASFTAAHAGYKAREIDEKFRSGIESDALLGDKDRKTRRRGGDARAKQMREAAAPQEAAVLRENENLMPYEKSERKRARLIGEKQNIPAETVRTILRRSK